MLTLPEVAKWRPAKDGTGPRTLRAFLESRPHPPGFGLKSGKWQRSRQMAQDWINAWVEDLHGEKMTLQAVVKLSGGLVGQAQVSVLWHRLERPWIPEDVVGWRPAPDGTGPQTFRDFLNKRGGLPDGFTLKSKGRRGARTSVVARGWINAWVAELYGKMTYAEVAELSGGLISKNQVGALWAGIARESDTRVPEVPGVLTRPEVVGWRPAKDGTGPRTLRAFLESRPHPPGFGLKSKDRPHSSQMAQNWINAWVEDLHEEMTQAEVVELSDGLVSRSHIGELWRRLEGSWVSEDVPVDVVGWRPAPDGTGPRTFRDFLNTRGDLPAGFTLKPKGRAGVRTSAVAQGWINAWAKKLYGKMPQEDVAELSGGLININLVGVLWEGFARESDAGVLTRPEVVGWRPAEDGTGPRTLRAFLESRPHPEGFVLKSGKRQRSSQMAQEWIDAWLAGLHEEDTTQAEVADMSGGLVSQTMVCRRWRRLEGPEIPEDVPGDVVDWRPAPDGTGPRTFRDFLNKRGGLPDGFELKSASRLRLNKPTQGWVNAWVAGLDGEMSYAEVAELSGGLINKDQVRELRAVVARGVGGGVPVRLAEEAAVARARSRALSRRESDSESESDSEGDSEGEGDSESVGGGGVWEVGDLAAVPVGNVFGVAIELADVGVLV
ncbi:hypothetical protein, partial [Amycolatopsis sp. NPDC102389]|uniref:hypothetical protein n=1 Tax=Amycolatopsis sp. NPDC102389 TaxID=3363941 RepID=UPI00381523D7